MSKALSKNLFLCTFITVNILFVFLLIYKKSYQTHISYEQQKLEKELDTLKKEKQQLTETLYVAKNPQAIKKFAEKNLGLTNMNMKQIKKIHYDNN